MNYTKHIFKGGDILYANDLNDITNAIEALSTQINTSTETDVSLSPATNSEYRYGEITSLTLTLSASVSDDYVAWLVFTSGTTPVAIDYPETIKWSGDDVIDGIFTPLELRRYNIGIWYDGKNINAAVRGASL